MTTEPGKELRLRHEVKHQINQQEDLVLRSRLSRLFPRDSHAGPDGSYRVTSLYFDTPQDRALRQKADGVDRREKFRLRYYGSDLSFIRLEKKYKLNGLCGKRSTGLTVRQVQMLLSGNISFLADSADPLLSELYSKLQGQRLMPKTVVCYDREAFTYKPGNVRITLDRRVRTGLSRTDFLNTELLCPEVLSDYTVLEVKYDAFLPDIVRMAVQVPHRQGQSCSKYALCRRLD